VVVTGVAGSRVGLDLDVLVLQFGGDGLFGGHHTHRYRTHRVQPFDTPTLTVWVSPATGVAAPPGAPSYAADPLTEHITRR